MCKPQNQAFDTIREIDSEDFTSSNVSPIRTGTSMSRTRTIHTRQSMLSWKRQSLKIEQGIAQFQISGKRMIIEKPAATLQSEIDLAKKRIAAVMFNALHRLQARALLRQSKRMMIRNQTVTAIRSRISFVLWKWMCKI